MRDALVELLGDAAAARDDLGEVGARLAARAQAIGLGMLHVVEHLGRAQQRLGRDAAPVEADAAEILALDDRGLEPQLRRADRGDIAAGPRAEDDEVVSFSHFLFLRRDRPRPVVVVERDEGELAAGHFEHALAVALAGFGVDRDGHRAAALSARARRRPKSRRRPSARR